MANNRLTARLSLLILSVLLTGCVVQLPEPSGFSDLQRPDIMVDEARLLDIAISPFTTTNLSPAVDDEIVQLDIRRAEAIYMPVVLQYTLRATDNWGEINVLPVAAHHYDLGITGEIIDSDSHTLTLQITAVDAAGTQWFSKRYTEHVGENVFGELSLGVNDPFQGLYNRIANDLTAYRRGLSSIELQQLRRIARLRFGERFAPQLYGPYLESNRRGVVSAVRLPPQNDPVHQRVQAVQLRDRTFHDALQEHYFNHVRSISETYFDYRRFSWLEVREQQAQQSEAVGNMVQGMLWLGVAAATADMDDALGSTVNTIAIIGGLSNLYQGITQFPTSDELLDELSESFANDVRSQVVELDEEVIILTGSVEEIYSQWQDLLQQMYAEDRGLTVGENAS